MAAGRLTAVVLGAVLLAGCAQAAQSGSAGGATGGTDSSASAAGNASGFEMSVSCSRTQAGTGDNAVATLPRGVTVTGAKVCKQLLATRPGRGTWQKNVTYEVVGGLDRLVKAYQQADGPMGSGPCAAIGHLPLLVSFTTPRGEVEAREPRGTCGMPVEAAVRAYAALRLHEIRAVWDRQVSSQRADDSGCAEQWKDMLEVERDHRQATALPRVRSGPRRVCVYTDTAPSQSGGDPHLSAAGTLTPTDARTLVAHLQPTAATACPPGRRTYAVLGEPDGDILYISLDACRGRALWDSGTGMLDPVGLRLLDHLVARSR